MRKVMLLLLGFGGSAVMAVFLLQGTLSGIPMNQRQKDITWPCRVDQTAVEVLAFQRYDGAFYEDGSGDPVTCAAAVIMRNTGSTTLKNGAVKLLQGREILVFSFTMVPPGARVLVVEKSKKQFQDLPISGCWGWTLDAETDCRLRIEEYGRSGLTVTNLTGKTISSAKISYKLYDQKRELYIGGYTYSVNVTDLPPGRPKVIPVYRYITGSSKVVG